MKHSRKQTDELDLNIWLSSWRPSLTSYYIQCLEIKDATSTQRLTSKNRTTDMRALKRGFVTTMTTAEEHSTRQQPALKSYQQAIPNIATLASCSFCQGKHALVDCMQFKSEPHEKS